MIIDKENIIIIVISNDIFVLKCVLFSLLLLSVFVIIVEVFIFKLIVRLIMVNVMGNVKFIVVRGLVLSKLMKKVFIKLNIISVIILKIIGMVIFFKVGRMGEFKRLGLDLFCGVMFIRIFCFFILVCKFKVFLFCKLCFIKRNKWDR